MADSRSFILVWIVIYAITINVAAGIIQLDFRVSPEIVKPLETTNVSLQCLVTLRTEYYNQQGNQFYYNGRYMFPTNPPPKDSDKNNIAMIRIVKNLQDKWYPIAQINSIGHNIVHKLDSRITRTSGIISDNLTQRSFILVSWDLATSDVYGMYRCDAISFDNLQNAVLTTSSQLTLGSSLDALAFLRLLKHETAAILDRVDTLENDLSSNHNLTEQLKTDILTLEDESEGRQNDLEEKVNKQSEQIKLQGEKIETEIKENEAAITERLDDIGGKIQVAFDSGFLLLWPRGSYGLLKPRNGCPFGGVTKWSSGWTRHHTESTDRNQDTLSNEIHLQQPILERQKADNFITQHFCIKTDEHSVRPTWPKGSYCINKKKDCPVMFAEGYVKWDEEDTDTYQTSEGELPDGVFNNETTLIKYCCRQDGPADVQISLPTSDPFYLYRYGGKCQSVYGMNVAEEFVVFDTENTDNKDEFEKIHPDGRINNVRLELCYYYT